MTLRHRLTFLALNLISAAGCAGSRHEARPDATTLLAYTRPMTDVTSAAAPLTVRVERIPEALRHDPIAMRDLRLSMQRQIGTQVKAVPEERYRALVRPRLARALLDAGLMPGDVDFVLGGVDYHRSL